jgi:predicted alpha-1,2-mannosidase
MIRKNRLSNNRNAGFVVYGSVMLLLLSVVNETPVFAAEPDPGDLTLFTGDTPVGKAFAGAMEPWGFVKISPAGNVGFTATSGGNTAQYDHYRNVMVRPWVGPIDVDTTKTIASIQNAERSNNSSLLHARILPWKIDVLATATRRCGLYEFTYAGDDVFHLLVDASAGRGWQFGTHVQITQDNDIVGWRRFGGGWAGTQDVLQNTYQLFFVIRADVAPVAVGTWRAKWGRGGTVVPSGSPNPLKPGNRIEGDTGHPSIDVTKMEAKEIRELQGKAGRAPADAVGAYLTFPKLTKGKACVKVGLSQISIEQARKNLDSEIPGWSLDEVERQARKKWNEALGAIQIEVTEAAHKQTFYQAFRNCMLCPTDKTNEHRKDPSAAYYDDWVAGWDSFPCRDPLVMLAAPKRYGKIMDGTLTASKYLEGFLFDVLVLDCPGPYQAYCNGEIWLAEAILKDIPFDQKAGFAALLHNATKEPPAYLAGGVGRTKGSYDYKKKCLALRVHGMDGCGEYGLTMTVADYAIALVARKFGDETTFKRFHEASLSWRKHWDEKAGVLCPEGFFNEHSPFWGMFNLRHDIGGLIQIVGGKEKMAQYLELAKENCTKKARYQTTRTPTRAEFVEMMEQQTAGPRKGAANYSENFTYHPFGDSEYVFWQVLYHWLGQPDRSAWITRGSILYRPDLQGPMALVYKGDDDGGGMTSYYLWCLVGLFPVAGQDVYLITSPCFPRVTFPREGKPFTVVAENVSRENCYVQSARLNDKPLTRAWFRHGEIVQGGRLVLVMGPQPSDWGRTEPPPSASDKPKQP